MAGALSADSALSSTMAPAGGGPAPNCTCLPSPGHPAGWALLGLDKNPASDFPESSRRGSLGLTVSLTSPVGNRPGEAQGVVPGYPGSWSNAEGRTPTLGFPALGLLYHSMKKLI